MATQTPNGGEQVGYERDTITGLQLEMAFHARYPTLWNLRCLVSVLLPFSPPPSFSTVFFDRQAPFPSLKCVYYTLADRVMEYAQIVCTDPTVPKQLILQKEVTKWEKRRPGGGGGGGGGAEALVSSHDCLPLPQVLQQLLASKRIRPQLLCLFSTNTRLPLSYARGALDS